MTNRSRQRDMILAAVRENKVHPTADEIYAALKPANPSLSLATVYRNLNQLSGSGVLRKIEVPGGADHFDDTLPAHYHLICEECSRMSDIPREYIPDFDETVLRETGCEIRRSNIVFYGVCNRCNAQKNH